MTSASETAPALPVTDADGPWSRQHLFSVIGYWLLAILTLGEGWHNHHHHYMNSSRLGFCWWEVDVGWYGLRALAALGLVSELRTPPPHIRDRIPS